MSTQSAIFLSFIVFAVLVNIYLGWSNSRIERERNAAEQISSKKTRQCEELLRQCTTLKIERDASVEKAKSIQELYGPVIDATTERQKILSELASQRQQEQAEIERLRQQRQQSHKAFTEQKEREEKQLREQLQHAAHRLDQQQKRAEQNVKDVTNRSQGEIRELANRIAELKKELKPLDEEANLQSFGFYKPHYDFGSSAAYLAKLEDVRSKQKRMVSDRTAAVGDIEWTVNGSKSEGRKSINQTLKLLLRAFNGECDAAIAKVRYNNIHVMETRIRKAHEAINALAKVQECRIVPEYLDLKMQELFLAHEYQEKVQAEKEEQRRIREQMREEEVARREIERVQQEAENEERRFEAALVRARMEAHNAVGAKQQQMLDQIAELERRLNEAHANKERAMSRAQMTRSGHVYVISNIGSFGENIYKIGMTRRLEPMDRVHELGDASVPFRFDVHAIIFAEDAPALESALHRAFAARRVNMVNEKREFFRVTLGEISQVVRQQHGEIEFTHTPEAIEYRKTLSLVQGNGQQVTLNGSDNLTRLAA
jgi:hypothetical protein